MRFALSGGHTQACPRGPTGTHTVNGAGPQLALGAADAQDPSWLGVPPSGGGRNRTWFKRSGSSGAPRKGSVKGARGIEGPIVSALGGGWEEKMRGFGRASPQSSGRLRVQEDSREGEGRPSQRGQMPEGHLAPRPAHGACSCRVVAQLLGRRQGCAGETGEQPWPQLPGGQPLSPGWALHTEAAQPRLLRRGAAKAGREESLHCFPRQGLRLQLQRGLSVSSVHARVRVRAQGSL